MNPLPRTVDEVVAQVNIQTSNFLALANSQPDNYPWRSNFPWAERYRGERNSDGEMNGLGEAKYAAHFQLKSYIGMYYGDCHDGLGESHFRNGGVYRGERSWLSPGGLHGLGQYTAPNGICFKGNWDHGRLNGKFTQQLDQEAEEIMRQRKQDIKQMILVFYKGDSISKLLNDHEDIRREVASFLL